MMNLLGKRMNEIKLATKTISSNPEWPIHVTRDPKLRSELKKIDPLFILEFAINWLAEERREPIAFPTKMPYMRLMRAYKESSISGRIDTDSEEFRGAATMYVRAYWVRHPMKALKAAFRLVANNRLSKETEELKRG